MKKACKIRMFYCKIFDKPASEVELLPQNGYICPDCKQNAVPYSGKTCTQILRMKK